MVVASPTLDILIATYAGNFSCVEENLPVILRACQEKLSFIRWRVVLSYNGGDSQLASAEKLAKKNENVCLTYVRKPGKGNAILNGIRASPADFVAYMDADLATDLNVLPVLVHTVMNADLVSGSRYHANSTIQRDWIRFLVSSVYTKILLRGFLGVHFTDPQCGFKAFNRKRIAPILDQVEDSWFFFETEFTYKAEQSGLRIIEIPVTWREQPNSSVKLIPTILNFLQNIWRLRMKHARSVNPPWIENVSRPHDASFSKSRRRKK